MYRRFTIKQVKKYYLLQNYNKREVVLSSDKLSDIYEYLYINKIEDIGETSPYTVVELTFKSPQTLTLLNSKIKVKKFNIWETEWLDSLCDSIDIIDAIPKYMRINNKIYKIKGMC